MKKIIFTKEEISMILKMYCTDKIGSSTISSKTGFGKKQILNLLKEQNVQLRSSGRNYLGGKKISDKKWREKPEVKMRKKNDYKLWSSKNREHLREYHKKWRENNVSHLRESRNRYEKMHKDNNPTYKLICNFRTAICTVLKEKKLTKYGHYFDILGYTQQDLIDHLDKLLNNGMTWENYGKWHVDHKIPISFFKFKSINDDEFKKCWSLDNLQPMWEKENLSKSNRIL